MPHPDPLYPSLFKRSNASHSGQQQRKPGNDKPHAIARQGGHSALRVIANAREHLDRARSHLNLPPLGPLPLGTALPPWGVAAEKELATSQPSRRRRQLQTLLDEEVRSLASKLGHDVFVEPDTTPFEADEASVCMARAIRFLQSGALRGTGAATQNEAQSSAVELSDERKLRKAAEHRAVEASNAANDAVAKMTTIARERESLVEQLAVARSSAVAAPAIDSPAAATAAQQAASEARAAERAAAQERENEQVTKILQLEAALELEKSKRQEAEMAAEKRSSELDDADNMLIRWLSSGGTDLLVELGGFGAHEALVEHECDVEPELILEAARQATTAEGSMPGSGMVHAVFKAVASATLSYGQRPVSPSQASQLVNLSEEAAALKRELEDAHQREMELQQQGKVAREEAAAAEARAQRVLEAETVPNKELSPMVAKGQEYLLAIENAEARQWWGEYIGARFATYQAVVDAIATWMKKMSAGMTDAEASIVAATVCHGIDRDGDGELTYAEFGRFADEFGQEFSVAKLREFEVDRADEADDEAEQEKRLKEYAEYLGIHPETESQLMHIAKKCMSAPLPNGWKEHCDDSTGNSYFYHEATQKTSWDHPLDSHFKAMVVAHRDKLH